MGKEVTYEQACVEYVASLDREDLETFMLDDLGEAIDRGDEPDQEVLDLADRSGCVVVHRDSKGNEVWRHPEDTCEGCDGSGVRDFSNNGMSIAEREGLPEGYHYVERCDLCEKHDGDLTAAWSRYSQVSENKHGIMVKSDSKRTGWKDWTGKRPERGTWLVFEDCGYYYIRRVTKPHSENSVYVRISTDNEMIVTRAQWR